jgi:hypothetical protein
MRRANTEEVLRTLHTLWKSKGMDTIEVMGILKEEFDLELTVLANGEIKVQSPDGKTKYSIK